MASDDKQSSSGGGILGFVTVLVMLSLMGGGAGFSLKFVVLGDALKSDLTEVGAINKNETEDGRTADAGGGQLAKPSSDTSKESLIMLEPIVATLAKSEGARIRIEASLIFTENSKVDRGMLLREVAQDFVVFLATTTLVQIQSASGLEYLREDLTELVQLRSKGSARGLVIKTLMVE